jgi:HAD superfamily hydrolase (TIGR01509 family)
MIDWVFIDVGNVLFNDDPQNFEGYRFVYDILRARHPAYTFEEMLAEREALARQGANFILGEIARRLLPRDEAKAIFAPLRTFLSETYDRHNLVNQGAVEALEKMRSHWRLGIIANQPPECRHSLERRGLLDFFDVVAISDELELHKPDVRIYQWALSKSGCDPSRSVMIGDRRDNDIAPAKGESMRAILVEWTDCRSKGWNPDDPLAQAFLDSCDRVPLFSAVPVGPEPDRSVVSLAELPAALSSLANGGNPPAR